MIKICVVYDLFWFCGENDVFYFVLVLDLYIYINFVLWFVVVIDWEIVRLCVRFNVKVVILVNWEKFEWCYWFGELI